MTVEMAKSPFAVPAVRWSAGLALGFSMATTLQNGAAPLNVLPLNS